MSLEALVSRMTELATLDPRHAIGGADTHRWQGEAADPGAIAGLEAAGVSLPASWRRWVTELVGVGAGPFRGTLPPPDASAAQRLLASFDPGTPPVEGPLPGFMAVASLPGRAQAGVIVAGDGVGEVWADLRGTGAGVVRLARDFEGFVEGWLDLAVLEWAAVYCSDGIPTDAPEAFVGALRTLVDTAAHILEGRAAEGAMAGMLARFGPPAHEILFLRGRMQLIDGDAVAAEASFAGAAFAAPADSGLPALGRCVLAAARGDGAAWLAASSEGLRLPGLSWLDRKRLLGQQALALETCERFGDALDVHIAMCEHDPKDLRAWLTVAYLMCHFGEFDRAVAWLRRVLELDTGLDPMLSLRDKMAEASASVFASLREEGFEDDATSLEEAIERYLLTAELWG
jgi:hypothetical protein